MGLRTTKTVTCDYSECKGGGTTPSVIQWNEEDLASGKVPMSEECKYLVFFNQGGEMKTFCGQLHASLYFLPPGYDQPIRKKVEAITPGAVSQPDGHAEKWSKDCSCEHPEDLHNSWGCTVLISNRPGDFCKCGAEGPKETKV